jgi:hypothetical protein
MKKLSILPALIVLVIGGVFAATQLFPPSNTEFPSVPTQSGTIGYILSLFGSDGTAPNTDRLGGVTASGYLQNNLCDPTKVWTGIDADGKAICGTRQTLLVGNFTEGSMSVKRGTAAAVALTANAPIYEWDLLITNSSQTGTIQFAQDASYIRLDTDTTVEIRTGQLGNNTVAEAILADGQLWGRIMTSTGVNLGGGGLVAGVRGTSVAITKNGTNVTIAIIDSTAVGSNAATISNENTATTTDTINISSGKLLTFTSGATSIPTPVTKTKIQLLADEWTKDNTIEDIKYLTQKIDTNPLILTELDNTLPNDIATLAQLTGDNATETDSDDSDIISDTTSTSDKKTEVKRKWKKAFCKAERKTYWQTTDKCEEKDLIAYAEYAKNNILYFKNNYININSSNNTYDISGKNLGTYTLSIEWATTNPVTNLEVYADMRDYDDEELLLELTATKTSSIINWTILKKASSFSKLIIKK